MAMAIEKLDTILSGIQKISVFGIGVFTVNVMHVK
jgi:hypothetical protein